MPDFATEVLAFLNHHAPTYLDTPLGLDTRFLVVEVKSLVVHVIPLHLPLDPQLRPRLSAELNQQNLRLVHLSEAEWRAKPAIVQSRLRALLGISARIPARLTQVRRIDKPTLDGFLQDNHLQATTNAKVKYGLFLPAQYFRILDFLPKQSELLVAVASFSGAKNIVRNTTTYRSYELIRFANLLNCTVVGGLDKLIKAFTKEILPDDLMTYADRDWSDGGSYHKLGFELLSATPPQAFWVNPVTFEKHTSEQRNDKSVPGDWIKVYNTGNWKFLKKMK